MSVEGAVTRRHMERLLRRTRTLCTSELQNLLGDGAAGQTVVQRISVAAEDLNELLSLSRKDFDYTPSAWEFIGENCEKQLAGLVALFGIALRRSAAAAGSASAAEREAFCSLRAALSAHLERLLVAREGCQVEEVLFGSIADALVRTGSIRCYALLLADLASQLAPPSLELCSPRIATTALAVAKEALALLEVLTYDDPERLEGSDDRRLNYFTRLGAEVADSCLLEHWSRTLLLASRCKSTRDEAATLLPRLTAVIRSTCLEDDIKFSSDERSLSYLMASHLVGLAAALDGGTTYGMPVAGPRTAVAPLVDSDRGCLQVQRHGFVEPLFAKWTLQQWTQAMAGMAGHLQPGSPWFSCSIRELAARRRCQLQQRARELKALHAAAGANRMQLNEEGFANSRAECFIERVRQAEAAVPPFNVAATRDVSMRLASSATEVLADPEAQPQQQRPRLHINIAALFGIEALKCARAAGWDLGWAPEAEHPPRKLEQLQRWWDLAARFVRAAAEPRTEWMKEVSWTRACVSELLPLRTLVDAAAASCPAPAAANAVPSADVAAALRAGYPQLLELLLRRPASTREHKAFSNPLADASADGWVQALAFGDPRVIASLLATGAKAARRAALKLDAAVAAAREEYAAAGIACANVFFPPDGVCSPDSQPRLGKAHRGLWNAVSYAREVVSFAECVLAPGKWAVPVIDRLKLAVAEAVSRPAAGSSSGPEAQQHPSSCSATGSRGGDGAGGSCGGEGAGSGGESSGGAARGGDRDAAGAARGSSSGAEGAPADGAAVTAGDSEASERRCGRVDGEEDEAGSGQRRADGGVDVEPQHAALRQLAAALSQVAVRVLPEATRLLASLEVSCCRLEDVVAVQCIMAWVPILAAASSPRALAFAAASSSVVTATETLAAPAAGAGGASAGVQSPQQPAADSAAAASVAAEWDRFLWVDMGLPRLLALASSLVRTFLLDPDYRDYMLGTFEKVLAGVLRALVQWAPQRLARAMANRRSAVTRGSGAAVASAGGSQAGGAAAAAGCHLLDMERLREVLGPEGKLCDRELLAALERLVAAAETAEAAPVAQAGTSAAFCGGSSAVAEPRPLSEELRQWAAAAALLVSPGEVRAVLPTCDNPACINLEGDSEAGLRLAGCGRCGGRVRYCSRECQLEHWRAGHKAQCAGCASGTK